MWTCLVSWKASRPSRPSSRPEPGLLEAAERAGVVVGQRVVDPDRAGPQLAHAADGGLEVAGVDVGAEAELGPVGQLDRLVERADPDDRRHRAEGLLAQQRRVRRGADDDGGGEEVAALLAAVVAADQDLGAGRGRGLELGDHLRPLRVGDHRPDVGRDLERVAEDEAAGVLDEGLDVVVVDLVGDVEALGRGADLAGVEERRPGAAAGGDLELAGRRRRRR